MLPGMVHLLLSHLVQTAQFEEPGQFICNRDLTCFLQETGIFQCSGSLVGKGFQPFHVRGGVKTRLGTVEINEPSGFSL